MTSETVYKTIYADPPWMEAGGGKIKRGADQHYSLMKTENIIAMKDFINTLIDPAGCHLYLWVTNNFLPDGLRVMDAWGFRYITTITWLKEGNPGLGQYYRGMTEHLLFGRRGNMLPYKIIDGKRAQGRTGFCAPRSEHSVKPEAARTMIERVSYPPYIELFARRPVERWDVWGNEILEDEHKKGEES